MRKFGIEFLDEDSEIEGFSKAIIHIGGYTERVYPDLEIWSAGDYTLHWDIVRNDIINGAESAIFCSSCSKDSFIIWPAVRKGDIITIFNFVCPAKQMVLEGHIVKFIHNSDNLPDDDDVEVSRWIVPVSFLKD